MSILLFSGGLDSYIGWKYLKEPKTIYFALGHRYQKYELKAIKQTIPNTIIDSRLSMADQEHPDAFIPLRNDLLIRMASLYDNNIWLVVQKGELELADRSPAFFLDTALSLSRLHEKHVTVSSPFFDITKTQMVEWYLENNYSVDDLLQTRSCYSITKLPCGACTACFRRWVSLEYCDIHEPMETNILKWSGTQDYIKKFQAGKYENERTDETLVVLKKYGLI